jgi:hypothetical protein
MGDSGLNSRELQQKNRGVLHTRLKASKGEGKKI